MVQQDENRLIHEYVDAFYTNQPKWYRQRLGPAMNPENARMMSVINRWADAVVFDGQNMVIIEAKMRPDPGAVGQLQLYAELLPQTPDFTMYANKPVRLVLVTTKEDLSTRTFCEGKGVEYAIYNPPWVIDYLNAFYGVGVK